jgi:hypothetical protein
MIPVLFEGSRNLELSFADVGEPTMNSLPSVSDDASQKSEADAFGGIGFLWTRWRSRSGRGALVIRSLAGTAIESFRVALLMP